MLVYDDHRMNYDDQVLLKYFHDSRKAFDTIWNKSFVLNEFSHFDWQAHTILFSSLLFPFLFSSFWQKYFLHIIEAHINHGCLSSSVVLFCHQYSKNFDIWGEIVWHKIRRLIRDPMWRLMSALSMVRIMACRLSGCQSVTGRNIIIYKQNHV